MIVPNLGMEMKMSKGEWSTIQKIPNWVVITPSKEPNVLNDEWVLRREAESHIAALQAGMSDIIEEYGGSYQPETIAIVNELSELLESKNNEGLTTRP